MLVTCIMPTRDRRAFVPLAIAYFLRQDYPTAELIVVDDGDDSVADLMPDDERVRYLRLEQRTSIGAKRNLACEEAHGSVILHWDDDDWHAASRVRTQVTALLASGVEVCGTDRPLFFEPGTQRAWQFIYPTGRSDWLCGNSLAYTVDFWRRTRFEDVDVGEDTRFLWKATRAQITSLGDWTGHVGIVHAGNVSPKHTWESYWQPLPLERLQLVLGHDFHVYTSGTDAGEWAPTLSAPPVMPPGHSEGPSRLAPRLPTDGRTPGMWTIAQASDLDLPEFVAYAEGQELPHMRRWELPWTLAQLQLDNTSSVLDVSINPAGFGDRLRTLFPHVLYYHRPVHGGAATPLLGVPDRAFDRVVCVNTLEHLLRQERATLIAELARKLKPGGLLVFTADQYFESAWRDPAFLSAGVMRGDGAEVVNGWNKVTAAEIVEVAAANDLYPLGPVPGEPGEHDPGLFCNLPPYPHACLGGVLECSAQVPPPSRRTVMLAMLTWNTREASIDSLAALMQESHLLRRLGHRPVVCVVDNGSTDGLPQALRRMEPELDVECCLVLNDRNLGSSIARNQILDRMRRYEADHVLFTDGDIEVVPHSTVAMLRHLEAAGSRLGCIGASSWLCSSDRAHVSRSLFAIRPGDVLTTRVVAWTQYGLFRREVFDDGVRFDEAAPFNGVGWGFEDNDLAFQMDVRGYVNQHFGGMTYLHRDMRSSIRIMRRQGLDPQALYEARKQYLIQKWAPVPSIDHGPLMDVRAAHLA